MARRLLPSALRHGITESQIHHALDHALVIADIDPDLTLYIGTDRAGNLLEVITIPAATEVVIHAMPLRRKYLPMLQRRRS